MYIYIYTRKHTYIHVYKMPTIAMVGMHLLLSCRVFVMCTHIHVYIHMYIRTCIQIYSYIHTYIYTHAYAYIYTELYIRTYAYVHVHTYVSIYIYTLTHTCIYTWKYACRYTYIYTYTRKLNRDLYDFESDETTHLLECNNELAMVLSLIWTSHVTHINESCHTYE